MSGEATREHTVAELSAEIEHLQGARERTIALGWPDSLSSSIATLQRMKDERSTLADLLTEKREWSLEQFGEGLRTDEILRHVLKEVEEIRAEPTDLEESVDLALLAMDLFWRGGGKPEEFLTMLWAKFRINQQRKWVMGPDGHAEHVK